MMDDPFDDPLVTAVVYGSGSRQVHPSEGLNPRGLCPSIHLELVGIAHYMAEFFHGAVGGTKDISVGRYTIWSSYEKALAGTRIVSTTRNDRFSLSIYIGTVRASGGGRICFWDQRPDKITITLRTKSSGIQQHVKSWATKFAKAHPIGTRIGRGTIETVIYEDDEIVMTLILDAAVAGKARDEQAQLDPYTDKELDIEDEEDDEDEAEESGEAEFGYRRFDPKSEETPYRYSKREIIDAVHVREVADCVATYARKCVNNPSKVSVVYAARDGITKGVKDGVGLLYVIMDGPPVDKWVTVHHTGLNDIAIRIPYDRGTPEANQTAWSLKMLSSWPAGTAVARAHVVDIKFKVKYVYVYLKLSLSGDESQPELAKQHP